MMFDERIISEARKAQQMSKEKRREVQTNKAVELRDRGYSNAAIARELFLNESSVRNLLKDH